MKTHSSKRRRYEYEPGIPVSFRPDLAKLLVKTAESLKVGPAAIVRACFFLQAAAWWDRAAGRFLIPFSDFSAIAAVSVSIQNKKRLCIRFEDDPLEILGKLAEASNQHKKDLLQASVAFQLGDLMRRGPKFAKQFARRGQTDLWKHYRAFRVSSAA